MRKLFNKVGSFYKKHSIESVCGIIVLIIALMFTHRVLAAPVVKVFSGTNNFLQLYVGVGTLNSLQLYNPSTNPGLFQVYDAPASNITYTNGGYSNYVLTTVTTTNSVTNYFGQTNTWTNQFFSNTLTGVAAYTTNYRLLAEIYVPSNGVATSILSPTFVTFGIFITNVATNVSSASNTVVNADISPRF